jgi:hypothetical protein
MSLVSLAVVGKDNDPLFLREYTASDEDSEGEEKKNDRGENDPYGFFSCSVGKHGESSLRHQVCSNFYCCMWVG